MLAARTDQASVTAPLALVVYQDDEMSSTTTRALRAAGYRTFAIELAWCDTLSLEGLQPAVVVLDIRRALLTAAKTLVELSKRSSSPPVLLVTDRDEGEWVAARFRLMRLPWEAVDRDLAHAVERTRHLQLRPVPPG